MESGYISPQYRKTGEQCLTLFATTVTLGSTAYFGGKTVLYIGGGLKNLGSQFLSTTIGSTLAKIVSWPFKQLWFSICWAGRGIKSLAFWAFSCACHPIESLKSSFNRIRNIVSFIFSWTILLVYQKTTSFVNHYFPSIRPPLIAAAIAAPIAFGASFFSHHTDWNEPEIAAVAMKSMAIFMGVLAAAPFLSQKFTSVSMSRFEAGNGTLFAGLVFSKVLENPTDY
jgi:hypothetical protein